MTWMYLITAPISVHIFALLKSNYRKKSSSAQRVEWFKTSGILYQPSLGVSTGRILAPRFSRNAQEQGRFRDTCASFSFQKPTGHDRTNESSFHSNLSGSESAETDAMCFAHFSSVIGASCRRLALGVKSYDWCAGER